MHVDNTINGLAVNVSLTEKTAATPKWLWCRATHAPPLEQSLSIVSITSLDDSIITSAPTLVDRIGCTCNGLSWVDHRRMSSWMPSLLRWNMWMPMLNILLLVLEKITTTPTNRLERVPIALSWPGQRKLPIERMAAEMSCKSEARDLNMQLLKVHSRNPRLGSRSNVRTCLTESAWKSGTWSLLPPFVVMVADGCVADSIDANGSRIATTILPGKTTGCYGLRL